MDARSQVRKMLSGLLLALMLDPLSACGAATSGTASGRSANGTLAGPTSALSTPTSPTTGITGSAATSLATSAGNRGTLPPKQTITEADNGKTIRVKVGDVLSLALRGPDGFQNWEIASPDARLLTPIVNPVAAAARGVTLRAFRAIDAGQTDLTATTKPICTTGQACTQVVRSFDVKVVVTS